MSAKGPVQQEIETRLSSAFPAASITVINDSAQHHGHAGDDGSGESHFSVIVECAAFEGVSRLMRQRMVLRALGDLPGNRVHALAIRAGTGGITNAG